jgi:hypothetical protein
VKGLLAMASILEFRKSGCQLRPHAGRAAAGASADIVLFPGVRYERYVEEAPQAKPRSRRSRRRDHLDLDD